MTVGARELHVVLHATAAEVFSLSGAAPRSVFVARSLAFGPDEPLSSMRVLSGNALEVEAVYLRTAEASWRTCAT